MVKRSPLALSLSLALVVVTGLSCDLVTAPPTTGGIAIRLLSDSGTQLSVAPSSSSASTLDLTSLPPTTANVLLDGVRVTVTGPSNPSPVTVTTATGGFFNVTVPDLLPGSYTVVVEGLVGGKVAHYGTTTTSVTAGATATASVTFPVFQPVVPNPTATDTVEVLHFTVSWSAVPNASSYTVEWSTSPTMASPQSKSVTTTTTEVTVTAEGKYYFTVRAVNAAVPAAGLPSPVKSVQVIQTVVSVVVTPSAPAVTAGATQQFTFEARDADNAVVANPPVLWVSNNHNVATISSTGLATTITSGTATISAVAKGTPGNATLTANPMPPTKLVFATPPTNTTAGQSIASVQVAIQNPQNQTATTDNTTQITLAFGTNAGGGTLGGTKVVTVSAGVATFNNLTVDKTGAGYTLSATSGTLTSATSGTFNITPAGAAALAFSVQPSATSAGSPISPAVQVEVQDALGNRAVGSSAQVTIAIGTNPGSGVLSGTTVVNAINGLASFSGLSIDKSGTGYTLAASSGGLTGATSSAFNVNAPTNLAFTVEPSNSVAGAAVSPEIQVEVRDAAGNRVTSARDAVTIAIATNPGSGTLSGTMTVNAVSGIATFSGVSINKTGTGYTLAATSGSLTGATSAAFNVVNAALAQVAFTIQPSNVTTDGQIAVQVTTQDAFGNVVPGAFGVTLAIANNAGGGSLSGTTTFTTSGGTSSINDLQIDKVGNAYTLVASVGSSMTATSAPFNVTVGAPAQLAFLTQPSESEPAGTMDPFQVVVQDAHGNATTTEIDVTVSLSSNPSNGALAGTTTVLSSGGIATFSDVRIDSTGAGYALQATGASVAFASSESFDVFLDFAVVKTGDIQTCGLTTRGSAYCWGFGGVGAIGDGGTSSRSQPTRVAGTLRYFALTSGYAHVCGISTADSTAHCWGYNIDGQLGMGSTGGPAGSGHPTPQAVLGGNKYFAISAGTYHTCGVRIVDSLAFCWGQQNQGRLGNSQPGAGQITSPVQVSGTDKFSSISAGGEHTCAVRNDRVGMCWGRQFFGRLGNSLVVDGSVTAPAVVAGGLTFLQISAGYNHSCGVRAPATDGRGYCWGSNGEGELGFAVGPDVGSPTEVSNSLRYSRITASTNSTCGTTTGGAGFCWGQQSSGRLGNGSIASASLATPQPIVGGLTFSSVETARPGDSFGGIHACAITTTGAYCWGGDNNGMLGAGTVNQTTPLPVRVRGQRP